MTALAEPDTITQLEDATVEIARLRGIIADIKNLTRYTANPRWALAGITSIISRRVNSQ